MKPLGTKCPFCLEHVQFGDAGNDPSTWECERCGADGRDLSGEEFMAIRKGPTE